MKMKLISGLAAVLFAFSACTSSNDNQGNWVELSSLDGIPRSSVVSFTIGDTGYMGLGLNSSSDEEDDDFNQDDPEIKKDLVGDTHYITEDGYMRDFWTFTPDEGEGSWRQIATFPGEARTEAVAFAAGGKGFVGTGYTYNRTDNADELADFYEYDPATGLWAEIDSFPGYKRRNAVAFAIGDNGYVGCGKDNNTKKDFYKYDTNEKSWTQINSIGGEKREGAQAFVLGDYAYVVSGYNNSADIYDVWRFDPEGDSGDGIWEEMIELDDSDYDFENVRRSNGVAFAVGGYGYVATGTRGGSSTRDVWRFDPETQEWDDRQDFEGIQRKDAAVFVINDEAYVGIGATSSSATFDDIWKFEPFADYESAD